VATESIDWNEGFETRTVVVDARCRVDAEWRARTQIEHSTGERFQFQDHPEVLVIEGDENNWIGELIRYQVVLKVKQLPRLPRPYTDPRFTSR